MGTLLPVLAMAPGLQGPVDLAKQPVFSVAAFLCGVSLYPCKSRSPIPGFLLGGCQIGSLPIYTVS